MATNIDLDPELLDHAMRLAGKRTKKDTIHQALEEFVKRREQLKVIEQFSTVDFDPGYDYKKQRSVS